MILKEKTYFKRKIKEYVKFIQKKKINKEKRIELTSKFSTDTWDAVAKEEKCAHTLSACKVCVYYLSILPTFYLVLVMAQ